MECAHCLRLNDGQSGGVTRRGSEADSCLVSVLRNSNAEDGAYDTTSLDADGITLNISNAFGTALISPYLSLGGSDFVEADVLQIGSPNATGNQTYTFTGLTDTPTLLLVQGTGRTTLGYGTTGAVFLGAADVNGQWAMMTKASESNPTSSGRIFRSDRCYAAHDLGSTRLRASLVSFGNNGTNGQVTLNWDAVAGVEVQIINLIALRGTFTHKVGVFTKATGPPWTNTIALGGTPRAAFVATAAMTAMGTPNDAVDHCRGGIGIYDGTRARAISWQDEDNVATSNIAGFTEDNGRILAISNNATASSNEELTPSFSGTDVVFTSAIEEAVAYEVGYVLLGDAAGGGVGVTNVAVTASVPSITISTGSSITAVNLATVASIAAPAIATGSTITATSISTSVTIPAGTLSAGSSITATTVATATTLGTPTVSTGATVTVSTVSTATSVPAPPSIQTGGDSNVSPITVAVTATIPAAAAAASSTVTATTVATASSVATSTISAGGNVAPATLTLPTSVGVPSIVASSNALATTVATTASCAAPTVTTVSGLVGAIVATTTTIPAPSLLTGGTVNASTVSSRISVATPDVDTGGQSNRRGCAIGETTSRRGCAPSTATNRRACATTVIPAGADVDVDTVGTTAGV